MVLKKRLFISLVGFAVMMAGLTIESKPVEISGRLKLFTSIFLTANPDGNFFCHDSGEFSLRRLEARLLFAGNVNPKISYKLRFDAYLNSGDLIDNTGFPESGLLGSPLLSEYMELNIYECAMKINGFLVKNLDLTVGKQRIFWGAADKVNVVDNLNPIDFANFFSFDPDHAFERRPQTAINLEYYPGKTTRLQLVWLLEHQISPLPYGYTWLSEQNSGLSSLEVETGWEDKLSDSGFGIRLTTTILNLDAGLSYYNGNASVPVLRTLSVLEEKQATFFYPRQQILGIDISGEAAGIGFWAEAALILPRETQASLTYSIENNGGFETITQKFSLFKKTYPKFVLGADYNFGKGFYANLQFLHGFFDEFDYSGEAEKFFSIGKGMFFGEPENYLIGQLQYSNSGNDLKLSLNWIYEIADRQALILTPALEFKISDGLLVQAGAFLLVSGDEDSTKFGLFRNDKLVYLGFRLDF
jgi:hypothetical protein